MFETIVSYLLNNIIQIQAETPSPIVRSNCTHFALLILNIVYYRKRKRITQLQLAELVDVDRSHISAIELGKVGVSLDLIFRLAKVLDVTAKDLFDFRY